MLGKRRDRPRTAQADRRSQVHSTPRIGELAETIGRETMKDQTKLESEVQEWLEEIKPVPTRNPQAAARGRAQFLGQAVSASEFPRHKGWKSIFRKERFAMNMIVSILVIAGLLFGGGATVNAAQNDLPNEPLYGLKLWSEDLSLQLQNDPEQKVERAMDLAQARIQEMTRLAETKQEIPDQVRQRLQDHIQQALQICATLEDPAMDRNLLQVRDRLHQQDRDMEQLQLHTSQTDQPILLQTRTMLRQRLQLVDKGLLNHEAFRNTVRNGFRFGQDVTATPPAQNGNGQPTLVPAGPNTNSGGPNPAPTGSSYGPGESNQNPGGPNTDAGGPNMSATPSSPTGGNGTGGAGTGGSGSGSGTGGGGGGSSSGGTGTGGSGSGGTGTGGSGSGTGTGGGGGSGSGSQGGRP
jgi:hypothetical protein